VFGTGFKRFAMLGIVIPASAGLVGADPPHGPQPILPESWMSRLSSRDVKKAIMRERTRIFFTSLELQIFITLVVLVDCLFLCLALAS